jgi:hypothetical protein
MDVDGYSIYGAVLAEHNISYLAYVCERGTAYRHFFGPVPVLHPVEDVAREIRKLNGTGLWRNVSLHFESLF